MLSAHSALLSDIVLAAPAAQATAAEQAVASAMRIQHAVAVALLRVTLLPPRASWAPVSALLGTALLWRRTAAGTSARALAPLRQEAA